MIETEIRCNSAQSESLEDILQAVWTGRTDKGTAKVLLAAVFPEFEQGKIDSIVDPLEVTR